MSIGIKVFVKISLCATDILRDQHIRLLPLCHPLPKVRSACFRHQMQRPPKLSPHGLLPGNTGFPPDPDLHAAHSRPPWPTFCCPQALPPVHRLQPYRVESVFCSILVLIQIIKTRNFMMLRSLYHVQNRHMIQFAVRQSCRHVDSLALIIS